jgi:hypothetical protein
VLTVLEVLTLAADELRTTPPSQYDSNSFLLSYLLATARDLRKTRAFPQSIRTHSFQTVADKRSYQFPKDFYSGLLGTAYNRSTQWALVGPSSGSTWNYVLHGLGNSGIRDRYRVAGIDRNPNSAGGMFSLDPVPDLVETISYDYISRLLFLPPHWTPGTAVVLNQKVNANGEIYICTSAGTTHASTAPSGTGTGISDGTAEWSSSDESYESPTSDDDLCLFDEDALIEGIKYRWYRGKRQDFTLEKTEYERIKLEAAARWQGSYVVDANTGELHSTRRVPAGSWNL